MSEYPGYLPPLGPAPTPPTPPLNRNSNRSSANGNAAIPNSHSLKGLGIGNALPQNENQVNGQPSFKAGELVKVWEQREPDPRRFVVEGLIPEGAVAALYGDGEQGKSYLVQHIANLVCTGTPFAGRKVERGDVLYLDGELQADEFIRRAHAVARGAGLTCPPEGLYYVQLPDSLSKVEVQQKVERYVREIKPTLIVLDSFTMSTFDDDPMDARPTIRIIKWLERLGTVLAIDHIRKPEPGTNLSQYTAFGSAFKRYAVRSQLQLLRADGGGLTLLHKKSNFAPKSAPIHLSMSFEPDRVRFEVIEDAGDERLAGASDNLPAVDQVYVALADNKDGATSLYLSQELGKSQKTVQNYLTTLKQQGRAESNDNGLWFVKTN